MVLTYLEVAVEPCDPVVVEAYDEELRMAVPDVPSYLAASNVVIKYFRREYGLKLAIIYTFQEVRQSCYFFLNGLTLQGNRTSEYSTNITHRWFLGKNSGHHFKTKKRK